MINLCYKWGNCDVLWKDANWTWAECRLVEEIIGGNPPGVPGELAIPPWLREEEPYNPYDKEKRKRFIRLICKVKGEPEYDEKKEVRTDINISLEDIALVLKKVKGIDVEILEE